MDEKTKLLKNTQLFSALKPAELKELAKYSDIVRHKNNSVIFREGSKGQSLFIIKNGGVRIIKKTIDGNELDIAEFIKGELFGEIDLFEEAPRSATAIAEEDTTLLMFPAKGKKFSEIIKKHPAIFANILHELIAMTAHRIRETNRLVSEKTKWIEELRSQLLYDKLTGMYNRSYIKEELGSLLAGPGRASLLFIKPDNFKYINDTFGHNAGDEALVSLANTIKANLKDIDIAIRYRGDEFVAVLPDTGPDNAVALGEVIKQAISNIDITKIISDREFHFNTSIGISVYPEQAKDAEKLVDLAFKKMMEIRNNGGNRVSNAM
jgi:diguanylate cyclase